MLCCATLGAASRRGAGPSGSSGARSAAVQRDLADLVPRGVRELQRVADRHAGFDEVPLEGVVADDRHRLGDEAMRERLPSVLRCRVVVVDDGERTVDDGARIGLGAALALDREHQAADRLVHLLGLGEFIALPGLVEVPAATRPSSDHEVELAHGGELGRDVLRLHRPGVIDDGRTRECARGQSEPQITANSTRLSRFMPRSWHA